MPSISGFVEGYTGPINNVIFTVAPYLLCGLGVFLLYVLFHRVVSNIRYKRGLRLAPSSNTLQWLEEDKLNEMLQEHSPTQTNNKKISSRCS